jgi:hypothetical protein
MTYARREAHQALGERRTRDLIKKKRNKIGDMVMMQFPFVAQNLN